MDVPYSEQHHPILMEISKSSSWLEVRSTPKAVVHVKYFGLAKDCIALSISENRRGGRELITKANVTGRLCLLV